MGGVCADLERRVLSRSVADGARKPGCLCSRVSHSRFDLASCVGLYKELISESAFNYKPL